MENAIRLAFQTLMAGSWLRNRVVFGLAFLGLMPAFGVIFFCFRSELYQSNLSHEPFYQNYVDLVETQVEDFIRGEITRKQVQENGLYRISYEFQLLKAKSGKTAPGFALPGLVIDPANLTPEQLADIAVLFPDEEKGDVDTGAWDDEALYELFGLSDSDFEADPIVSDSASPPVSSNNRSDIRSTRTVATEYSDFDNDASEQQEHKTQLRGFVEPWPNITQNVVESFEKGGFAGRQDIDIGIIEVTSVGSIQLSINYDFSRIPFDEYASDLEWLEDKSGFQERLIRLGVEGDFNRLDADRLSHFAKKHREAILPVTEVLHIELIPSEWSRQPGMPRQSRDSPPSVSTRCDNPEIGLSICQNYVLPGFINTYSLDPRNRDSWSHLSHHRFHWESVFESAQVLMAAQNGRDTDPRTAFARMMYFSAVNLTTLGYGDITPITTRTRMLVALQSVLGIVFMGMFLNALATPVARKRDHKLK